MHPSSTTDPTLSRPEPGRPRSPTSLNRSGVHGLGSTIAVAFVLLAAVLPGCDSGFPSSASERTISDEAFVETIVALRRGSASDGEASMSAARRDEILSAQGVTEEELFHFVEVHGRNVPRMSAVWTEVEARLTGQDPEDLELDDDLEAIPGPDPGAPGPDGDPSDALPGGGVPGSE